jgi:hypothetical protein
LHGGVGLGEGRLHGNGARVFEPFEVEAGTGELAAFQVRHRVPVEGRGQVVAVVGDQGDERLIELVVENLGEERHLVVDGAGQLDALLRAHGAERQHDLEGMQGKVGGLEAEAKAADIDDAGLHAFEGVRHLDHGPAIALDELELVLGALGDAFRHLGHEEILHQVDVGVHRRVTRGDAEPDVFGMRRGRAAGQQGSSGDGPCPGCAFHA